MPRTSLVVLQRQQVGVVVEEPGQAEVEDLHAAVAVEQDVARLDVAVDQPGLVGVLQARGAAWRM